MKASDKVTVRYKRNVNQWHEGDVVKGIEFGYAEVYARRGWVDIVEGDTKPDDDEPPKKRSILKGPPKDKQVKPEDTKKKSAEE